jgi:DNA-binding NarL/FixJ family response regulator
MPFTRILIIDDHKGIVDALVRMLERDFTVVGASLDGKSGLSNAVLLNPEIIILDISLPDIDGLEVARRLRSAGGGAKIVFLSNHEDPEIIHAAFDAGASGYVFKTRLIRDLINAIELALQDAAFMPTMPRLKGAA